MPDFKLLVQPSAFHHPDLSPHRAQSPHGQTWPQSERNTEVFLRKTVRPLTAVQTQDTGAVLTERQGAKLKVKLVQSCLTLCATMDCPWNSLGQNTGVGNLSLLQGIFPTQRSNPGLPHCRQILCQPSHKGSPRILEWVSLFLLQWIFPTQDPNWGLLHCRWILYQLSYRGTAQIQDGSPLLAAQRGRDFPRNEGASSWT